MSIKDKIAIGLIILSIVLFGIAINGFAYDINDRNLDDMAYQAANDANGFMSVSATNWANKTIDAGNYKSGNYKSGICMYHVQSNNGHGAYKITDVLDFSFDGNGILLTRNGYSLNSNEYTGTLAKALYTAYSTGEYYSEKNWGISSVKEKVVAAFSQAAQQGGIQATSSFYTNIRNDDKVSFNKSVDTSYGAIAKNYKSVTKNIQDSEVKVQHEAVSSEGYTMIGPFNVTFTGKPIEKVGIYSDQKEFVNGNGGGIYYSTYYKTIDGAATNIANGDQGWSNNISNIPSGVDFYIIVSDKGEEFNKGNNLRVTIYQQGMEYYHARLVLAQNPKAQGQNMGIFAAEQKYYTGQQTFNIAKKTPIDLTVVKSGNNSVKQANVNFRLTNGSAHAIWGSKEEQNGIMVYSNITFGTWEDTEKQIFTTGSTGKFIVKDLDGSYTYSLQETWNPNAGYSTVDIKNATLSNGVASVALGNTVETNKTTNNLVTGIRLSSTQSNILEIIDRKEDDPKEFDIHINKVNTSGSKLKGAEFKIKVYDGSKEIGWLYYDIEDEVYDYNNKYSKSTTWSSSEGKSKNYTVYADEQGEISILGLSTEYKYKIYEFKPATNYLNLLAQTNSGMKVTIDGKTTKMSRDKNYISKKDNIDASVYCGTVSYDDHGSSVTVKVTNVKGGGGGGSPTKYLYIGGKIWIDEKDGKQKVYDDLYNSSTENLYKQSVKVSLINSSGTTVKTTTTTSGTYSLNTGIAITSSTSIQNSLSGYYLKFEYSDKYSTVSPKFKDQNGSKALIQEGQEGIAYIYNLSDYVETFYKYPTLDHMNMGLIGIEQNDYEINQNIAYVKVVMNGYTYTYEYGGTGDSTKTAAPTVSWKNGSAYTRAIYPSDIAYSNENNWDEDSLKIYVVYRININNTNMMNYGKKKSETTSPVSYVEVDLKVTSLTNTFDTDRYELETKYDKEENEDFANWKDNNGVATYTGNKLNKGIAPNSPRTVYIQFKVKKEALNNLLNQKETYEKTPTIAKTEAYHNYWKAYYVPTTSGGIKLVFGDRKTDTHVKTASAYYLRLKINTERTITGTVFEDENIYTNGEVLGDGKYGNKKDGSKENAISNVKVELISKNGNKAKLYSSSNSYNEKEAETVSSTDGTYSFVGVTPGKYYVRFTYGDGTQKVCSIDSSDGKYKETSDTISIADYKSTVATDECIQSALGYQFDNKFKAGEEWYKHEEHRGDEANKLYSTATDNLTQRADYNKDNASRTNIEANTALMSVGVENTVERYATINKSNDGTKETILGINFGIIDIPEVSMAFDKVVSNIQITNAQGNIIVEGNPATQNIKYVSDLDKGAHLVDGSQYIKSEINEQELYGSTLKLQYSITVQNNSETNYYEDTGSKYYGYYYMFGDSEKSKEVTITVDNVLDFIDPAIKYENISIDDKHKITQVKASDNQVITDKIQAETNLTYSYLVDITDWKELYTTKNKDAKYAKDKTQDTADLTVTRLLSADDDDLGVSNVAQVTKIHVTNTPALVETIDASEVYFNDPTYVNPTEEVYVTITPPTGEDKLTTIMYVIIEIIALSAISAGIVLIKKKVLDK